MPNFNAAPNFDDYDDEPTIDRTIPRTRPNVPPYRIAGDDPNALPVLIPPRPLPSTPPLRSNVPPPAAPATTRPQRAVAPRPRVPQPAPQLGQPTSRLNQSRLKLAVLGVSVVLAAFIAYLLVSNALRIWQTWQDDMTYGRPRTMQIDQFVGHNEQDGAPSHFIVQNNNRQITVVEYPGGDSSKTRVFQGARLFGKDAELIPVKIRFEDINGDGHVDMILTADDQLIVYINQDSNFRPISAEERLKYKGKLEGTK